ncbi:MAG: hypothetical protein AAB903_01570 [Patescibacteria group bacterium]
MENRGIARIFVHPFYEYYSPSQFHKQDPKAFLALNPRVMAIKRACFRLVGRKNAPPLIFFEEERRLDETRKRLAPYIGKNTVYYVPTLADRGIPKTEPFGVLAESPETFEDWKAVWGAVMKPLLGAGIHSAIVGGMFLEIFHEKDRVVKPRNIHSYRAARRRQGARYTLYDIQYCAGSVVKEMSRHFVVVQVSCLAHPHSYGDIKRVEQGGHSSPLYPTTAQRQSSVV